MRSIADAPIKAPTMPKKTRQKVGLAVAAVTRRLQGPGKAAAS
jgi:hypothetical protein